MCRFLIYMSSQHVVRMADVVTEPEHSIIRQSYSSCESVMETELPNSLNGDGFGVGWYASNSAEDSEPCVFTSTQPAWNNRNLYRLAKKVEAHVFFAHIRAASRGLGVNDANCHPFAHGPYLFMHNGGIQDFLQVKRALLMRMSDEAFQRIEGSTDSECAFALFCSFLPTTTKHSLQDMETAMLTMIRVILRTRYDAGLSEPAASSMNFAVTNGQDIVATRFIETEKRAPATLYFTCGTKFARNARSGEYEMKQIDRREEAVIIASERLTATHEDWIAVPRNTMLSVTSHGIIHLKPIDI